MFENGFFAEGFVWLCPKDTSEPSVSIPFVGFCGDWNAPPVFSGAPNSNARAFYTQYAFSYLEMDYRTALYALGSSAYYEEDTARRDLISISPNGDGWGDFFALQLTPQRNAKDIGIRIYAKDTGEVVYEEFEMGSVRKGHYISDDEGVSNYNVHYLWDGSDASEWFYMMPDGVYTVDVVSLLDWGGENVWSMDFTVDTVKPVIDDVFVEQTADGRRLLHVKASDDKTCIQYLGVYTSESDVGSPCTPRAAQAAPSCEAVFDISDVTSDHVYLEVADFAFNLTIAKINIG